MRKYIPILLCTLLGAAVGCQEITTDDNKPMEYESLQVNFSATLPGQEWPAGTEIGVIATCTREDAAGKFMSENSIASYKTTETEQTSLLKAASDKDKITALASDHNIKVSAVYPYPKAGVNVESIPVAVPEIQNYSDGVFKILTYIGSATPLTVVPTVDIPMSTMFSILEFMVPNDLVDGYYSILESLTITPTNPLAEGEALVQGGKLNALTGKFAADKSADANEVKLLFGENGLALNDSYTKISVVVAPFTVPEGGLTLKFKDVEGLETVVKAFASEKEVGKKLAAGETMSAYVSGISDGIIPVTFPVVFPMGYPEGSSTGYNAANNEWLKTDWYEIPACNTSTRTSEMWVGHHGTVHSMEQQQALLNWYFDGDNQTGVKHYIEVVNSAANKISTFGVKCVWTNDYWEFVIPVRKFKANSKLKLTMPLYTRSGPTFWEILYKDGEQWVSTAVDNLPAFEGSDIKRKATWALPFGGAANASNTLDTDQTVTMTFANAVASGNILIHVKCVDGSIVSDAAGSVKIVEKPGANPYYFWNPGKRDDQAIKIELL